MDDLLLCCTQMVSPPQPTAAGSLHARAKLLSVSGTCGGFESGANAFLLADGGALQASLEVVHGALGAARTPACRVTVKPGEPAECWVTCCVRGSDAWRWCPVPLLLLRGFAAPSCDGFAAISLSCCHGLHLQHAFSGLVPHLFE